MAVDYEEGRRLLAKWRETIALLMTPNNHKEAAIWSAKDKAEKSLADWMTTHAEALLNPDPWRPIDELPEEWKDGRELLFAVRYDIQELEPHTDYWIDHWDGESGLRMWGSFIHIPLPPTHFRELKGPGHA